MPSTDLSNAQATIWRERLAAFRADANCTSEAATAVSARRAARPEFLRTLEEFLNKTTDLKTLRDIYHRKSASEWASFGATGFSGAMVLNQLSKYLPDNDKVSEALRELMPAPKDEESAALTLRSFINFLNHARSSTKDGARLPSEGRIPFFASINWHIQCPDAWPPYYITARNALSANGLLAQKKSGPAGDYLAFRKVFMSLQRQLDVSMYELEHLLSWVGRDEGSSDPTENDSEDLPAGHVWLIALGQNADQWEQCFTDGVIAIGWNDLEDLREYETIDDIRSEIRSQRESNASPMNAGLACWQFANTMKEGDTVYVKRGRHSIIGYGIITSGYRFEEHRALAHVRSVKWLARGEWQPREKLLAMKTLTEIGRYPGLIVAIKNAIGSIPDEVQIPVPSPKPALREYSMEDACKDLFISRESIQEIQDLCLYKKNIILQGPPGVGKTYIASRIANLLVNSTDEEQIQRVQFHPSYSYEDFVQGLRPVEGGGFQRQDGPLLRFCKDALEDQDSRYVLIVDEINRGNVSKILGELLSLLEADKRDPKYGVCLAYAREEEPRFHLPPNLLVIGMMNTADRSLALVDYALRRRFAFISVEPAFGTDRFVQELTRRGVESIIRNIIQDRLGTLNEMISQDPTLGHGFMLGHSYFCHRAEAYDATWFNRIADYEIIPLLREYWFDNAKMLSRAIDVIRGE